MFSDIFGQFMKLQWHWCIFIRDKHVNIVYIPSDKIIDVYTVSQFIVSVNILSSYFNSQCLQMKGICDCKLLI